jgi:hypothetical protein
MHGEVDLKQFLIQQIAAKLTVMLSLLVALQILYTGPKVATEICALVVLPIWKSRNEFWMLFNECVEVWWKFFAIEASNDYCSVVAFAIPL